MKNKLLLFFSILAISIYTYPQSPDIAIKGFAGLEFGMEKHTAIEKIQSRKEAFSEITETSDTYRITYINTGGILFDTCDLYFYDNKLMGGAFSLYSNSQSDAIAHLHKIKNSLQHNYDAAHVESEDLAGWQSMDKKAILLSLREEDNGYIVRLTYLDRLMVLQKEEKETKDF